ICAFRFALQRFQFAIASKCKFTIAKLVLKCCITLCAKCLFGLGSDCFVFLLHSLDYCLRTVSKCVRIRISLHVQYCLDVLDARLDMWRKLTTCRLPILVLPM